MSKRLTVTTPTGVNVTEPPSDWFPQYSCGCFTSHEAAELECINHLLMALET